VADKQDTDDGALGGIFTAPLIVNFGWPSAFLADGFASLTLAVLLFFMLPESARFLAVVGGRERELAAILRKLRPDLAVDASSRFTVAEHGAEPRDAGQAPLHRRARLDYVSALDRLHHKSDGTLFPDELAPDGAQQQRRAARTCGCCRIADPGRQRAGQFDCGSAHGPFRDS
jgi:hypothetical protein